MYGPNGARHETGITAELEFPGPSRSVQMRLMTTRRDTPFVAGGEMAALVRDTDWSVTPLGAPLTWPHSLRTVVGILLTSRYAMWMGWGPDLSFLYNDAYGAMAPSPCGGGGFRRPWTSSTWTRCFARSRRLRSGRVPLSRAIPP